MKQAVFVAKTSAKFSVGLGLSTLFISTMDDVIYANFRKNIIMPLQMVAVKGQAGSVQGADLKALGDGTQSFIKDMKPHALTPANAKELILKDADYSTPQDHYFGYVQRTKSQMADEGLSMKQMNERLREQELDIIRDLYDEDQQTEASRAEAIDRYIDVLHEKRRPRSMTQIFEELTDTEKMDIEQNWGTTLAELKELARQHDS